MTDLLPPRGSKVLRLPEVSERIGLSRTAIYDRINARCKRYDPTFPKPISLGARAVGWFEHQIDGWLQARAGISFDPS
jgi:prophage regulatory protein